MLYDTQTYEIIMDRILTNVDSDLDKREGSVTFNLLAPLADELFNAYSEMGYLMRLAFIEDNFDDFLEKRVNEFGIFRKDGEYANGKIKVTGSVGTEILNGEIVKCGDLKYVVVNDVTLVDETTTTDADANTIYVVSMEVGYKYNIPANSTLELDSRKTGITSLTNAEAFTDGVDIETDEELRERFKFYIKNPRTSGNKYHYEQWALECDGVGKAKVLPLWNGNGTVKVIIIGNDNLPCSTTTVNTVKDYIEEQRPIGATVTVETPTLLEITVTATINLNQLYILDEAKQLIEEEIEKYVDSLEDDTKVIYAKIFSAVGDLDCVDDIIELKVNSGTTNINITDNKIPVLKTLTVTQATSS